MKSYPWEFESKKEVLFYPEKPTTFAGDILEIGPGRGDLLLSLAESFPAKRFVAVEVGKKRYLKLIPRIERKLLTNILLIHGDARIVLPRYFEDETFERIYVLFPDPWPKKRHAYKRLLTTEFITLLAKLLKVEGDLIIASDVRSYIDWLVENARRVELLHCVGSPFVDSSVLENYEATFFEAKWREAGRAIYYLWYRRVDRTADL
ncbi:MAG: tRNA (guanine(46)-N(7))-methyltransferase TrmB [Candidatus Zixiibacteriota bacterium]